MIRDLTIQSAILCGVSLDDRGIRLRFRHFDQPGAPAPDDDGESLDVTCDRGSIERWIDWLDASRVDEGKPTNRRTRNLLSDLHAMVQKGREAEEKIEKAIAIDNAVMSTLRSAESAVARLELAATLIKLGGVDEALELIRSAIDRLPSPGSRVDRMRKRVGL